MKRRPADWLERLQLSFDEKIAFRECEPLPDEGNLHCLSYAISISVIAEGPGADVVYEEAGWGIGFGADRKKIAGSLECAEYFPAELYLIFASDKVGNRIDIV